MQLKDFMTQSVLQIIDGVKEAQEQNKTDARISPSGLRLGT